MAALFAWLERPCPSRALLLAVALGLALATQYKGALLLIPLLAAPLWVPRVRAPGNVVALVGIVTGAAAVFLLVNYPALMGDSGFATGLDKELNHVLRGHSIKVRPLDHAFSFHFLHSLVPGLTAVVAWLGLAGFVAAIFSWRRVEWRIRLLFVYGVATFLAHELTPMKAHPDFMRFMIPTAPIWVFFAVWGLWRIESAMPPPKGLAVARILAVAVVAIPLQASIRLDYHLERDTRTRVESLIGQTGVLMGRYTTNERVDFWRTPADELRRSHPEIVVVSSFNYGRYEYAATLPDQTSRVRRQIRRYEWLFSHPYEEVHPAYRSFAFSNPTLRIVKVPASAWALYKDE